jgi:hypothetical protein
MAAPAFLSVAPTVEIRDGIAFIEVDGRQVCCMAVATLIASHAAVEDALAGFGTAQHAQIVRLSQRGPMFLYEDFREA